MSRRPAAEVPGLARLLVVSVVVELVLLRIFTRTLVHIPGVERLEGPVRIVAEIGRFAFYVALVSLAATLGRYVVCLVQGPGLRRVVAGVSTACFLGVAVAGRLGWVPQAFVGWTVVVVLGLVAVAGWDGLRSLPLGLYVVSWWAAAWSVLGQSGGIALSGASVDLLVSLAEVALVGVGLTAPLLVGVRPGRTAKIAGLAAAVVTVVVLSTQGATVDILVLWNVGIPGWLPGAVYGLAIGGLVTALWTGITTGESTVVSGVVLLVAGGVGTVSTYQSGLATAALLVLAWDLGGGVRRSVPADPHPAQARTGATAAPRRGAPSGTGRGVQAGGPVRTGGR